MSLTDARIRTLKPNGTADRLIADGGGLYQPPYLSARTRHGYALGNLANYLVRSPHAQASQLIPKKLTRTSAIRAMLLSRARSVCS